MDTTPILFPPELESILTKACAWCEEQEQSILSNGVSLTTEETEWAKQIGVAHPERVRLLCVDEIPLPQDPVLRAAAEQYGFLSPSTSGLSLRYGILINRHIWREKLTIVHEMVHTVQYERLGGFGPFLRQYLGECLTVGYSQSPLEREAVDFSLQLMGQGTTMS